MKLQKQVKNLLINTWDKINNYLKKLNTSLSSYHHVMGLVLTLLVIYVSIASTIATIQSKEATEKSTNATISIRIVEEQLYKLNVREEIKRKIDLANNLNLEIEFNKASLDFIKNSEVDVNNLLGIMEGDLKLDKLQDAIKLSDFGDFDLRVKMELLISRFNSLERDLQEIKNAASVKDNTRRIDRWNSAIRTAVLIHDSEKSQYVEFQKKLQTYIKSLESNLQEIDKQISDIAKS